MSDATPSLFPCRSCDRHFRVRKDGRIPRHRANKTSRRTFGKECYGSGIRPKKLGPQEPDYVTTEAVIADVRRVAYENGYAVGLHGSLRQHRDIDLIAAPWVEDAKAAASLFRAVGAISYLSPLKKRSVKRPHGRVGRVYLIRWRTTPTPAYVDLSVMPRV